MTAGWLAGCLVLLAAGPAPRAEPGWSAFPGDGFVAEGGRDVHDPALIRVGDRWFCFCTHGDGFGMVRASDDLDRWTELGPVLPRTPTWLRERIPEHRSLWAPDVIRSGDCLRMYYSASRWFGRNESVIGLAQCDHFDPAEPLVGWRDLGLVLESRREHDEYNAIDPEVVADPAGRHWLFFGSWHAGLYVVALDPETGKLQHPDSPDLTPVARNRGGVEAPSVLFRRGFYYLFMSYGTAAQGVRSTYHVVVGRSRAITGPYLDAEGRSLLDGGHAVVLRSSAPMFGPGHCDVLTAPGGRSLLAYHFYDARRFWVDDKWGLPTLQIRELLWTADGWPLPGMPIQQVRDPRAPRPAAGNWIHQADFGRVQRIVLTPDGVIEGENETGAWSQTNGVLTLRWPNREAPGTFWVDQVQCAPDGRYYAGRNQAGMLIRGARVAEDE